MAHTDREPDGRGAAERTVAVLQALAASPSGASLTELAKATGIPNTSLHRILRVLRSGALVKEAADGRYALAAGTVALARSYLDGLDLRREARAVMRPLATESGETCHLGVLALVHVVYIERVDGPSPVRMHSRVGQSDPALTSAIGRVVLAHSAGHVLEEVVEAHTRHTGVPVDRTELDALLTGVRAVGYALDLQETELGGNSVAAPVFDHAGHVTAGLSLSAPATRRDAEAIARLGPRVSAAAQTLSYQLGWPGPGTGRAEAGVAAGPPAPTGGRTPAPRRRK